MTSFCWLTVRTSDVLYRKSQDASTHDRWAKGRRSTNFESDKTKRKMEAGVLWLLQIDSSAICKRFARIQVSVGRSDKVVVSSSRVVVRLRRHPSSIGSFVSWIWSACFILLWIWSICFILLWVAYSLLPYIFNALEETKIVIYQSPALLTLSCTPQRRDQLHKCKLVFFASSDVCFVMRELGVSYYVYHILYMHSNSKAASSRKEPPDTFSHVSLDKKEK